jgi:hypothetical protein
MPVNLISQVDALLALGFKLGSDGTLVAPDEAVISLALIGNFYELRITFDNTVVTAILSRAAVKVARAGLAL